MSESAWAGDFSPVGYRADDRAVVVGVEEGTRRVRLQVREGEAWRTVTMAHLDGRGGHVKLRLPEGVAMGDLRCEVSSGDPFPYSYYAGATAFSEVADQPNAGGNRGLVNGDATFAGGAPEGSAVAVEESDIWKWRGRMLYFFNTYRGLQVFDLSDASAPAKVGALRMPAVGEQMYLVGDEHVVLLANRYDYSGSGNAGSEVVVVHHGEAGLAEVARFPVEGNFVESRLVGERLYAVTRVWEQTEEEPGRWVVRTGLKVYAYDLGDPAAPELAGELELVDDGSGYYYNAVVTATPDYLFVTPATYDQGARAWNSEVFVIGIGAGDELAVEKRVRLAGRLNDKFKLRESGGVLTTVSQVAGSGREAETVVETFGIGGDGVERLDSVGLAPGETVRATRFDGTRLYVVTFRQVDPLFLVDLSDPTNLQVTAELEVPGWSTYLEPMAGGERLLSVGVEERRVAVSLFDVSEPSELSMVERVYLGDEGGYSWSEGNYNEKAVGFFEAEGLFVLPFSGYEDGAYRNQMQLVDVGADGLVKRGVVETEFNARRSKLFDGDTLVAVSGRVLRVLDVADRDAPALVASLSIAWPAERVLAVGDRVWQFENGSYSWWDSARESVPATVRVTSVDALDTVESEISIGGGGQVAGAVASADGEVVYVLTTRTEGEEVIDEGTGNVLRWEYESVLTTHVVVGGAVVGSAEVRLPERWYYGMSRGIFLPGGELVWVPDNGQRGGYWWRCLACDFGGGAVGDVAWPYYGGQGAQVVVLDVESTEAPEVVASFELAGDGEPEDGVSRSYEFGDVFLDGERLLYGYREWWWSGKDYGGRHSVREVDLGVPAAPVFGEAVSVPGMLRHVVETSGGGTVLLTTRERVGEDAEGRRVWTGDEVVEASAFDGVTAFLLDEVVAEGGASTAVAGWGRYLFKSARWNWWGGAGEGGDGVRVFGWDEVAGKLGELPLVEMASSPWELAVSGGYLFGYRSGGVDVVGLGGLPGGLEVGSFEGAALGSYWWSAPPVEVVGDGSVALVPVGIYGVERLDLGDLAGGDAAAKAGKGKGGEKAEEWLAVGLSEAMVTRAGGDDFVGRVPSGYAWRFEPASEPVGYGAWAEARWNASGEAGFEVPAFDGDEDGDGVNNGVEYLLGESFEGGLVGDGGGGRVAAMRYLPDPAATGVRVGVEFSADLEGWREAVEGEDVVTVREGAFVVVRLLGGEDGFWRLVVVEEE